MAFTFGKKDEQESTQKSPPLKKEENKTIPPVIPAKSVPETSVSVIRLVDSLILSAYEARASDIHIDPTENGITARFRIDGVLHDSLTFKKELQSEIITRIKIVSGMRTDEHQAAQDGRFKLQVKTGGEYIDVRVSVAPTYYGENCVMRLLSGKSQGFTLDRLGFSPENLAKIKKAIPSGRNIKKITPLPPPSETALPPAIWRRAKKIIITSHKAIKTADKIISVL